MSEGQLSDALDKIRRAAENDKVTIWVTPTAENYFGTQGNDEVIGIMADAFRKNGYEIASRSEPFKLLDKERPDVSFLSARLSPREPYTIIVQASVGENVRWYDLLCRVYMDANHP